MKHGEDDRGLTRAGRRQELVRGSRRGRARRRSRRGSGATRRRRGWRGSWSCDGPPLESARRVGAPRNGRRPRTVCRWSPACGGVGPTSAGLVVGRQRCASGRPSPVEVVAGQVTRAARRTATYDSGGRGLGAADLAQRRGRHPCAWRPARWASRPKHARRGRCRRPPPERGALYVDTGAAPAWQAESGCGPGRPGARSAPLAVRVDDRGARRSGCRCARTVEVGAANGASGRAGRSSLGDGEVERRDKTFGSEWEWTWPPPRVPVEGRSLVNSGLGSRAKPLAGQRWTRSWTPPRSGSASTATFDVAADRRVRGAAGAGRGEAQAGTW